jgi:hypothetical protein
MEKLNQYAPYALIVCGGLITILGFMNGSTTRGIVGLIFLGMGIFTLSNQKKNN